MNHKIINELTEFIKHHIDNKGKLKDSSYETVLDKSIELGVTPLEFNKILKSLANNKEKADKNVIKTKSAEQTDYVKTVTLTKTETAVKTKSKDGKDGNEEKTEEKELPQKETNNNQHQINSDAQLSIESNNISSENNQRQKKTKDTTNKKTLKKLKVVIASLIVFSVFFFVWPYFVQLFQVKNESEYYEETESLDNDAVRYDYEKTESEAWRKYGSDIYGDTPQELIGVWGADIEKTEFESMQGRMVPKMSSIYYHYEGGVVAGSWMKYFALFEETNDKSDIIYVFKTAQAPWDPKIKNYKPSYSFFKIKNGVLYMHKNSNTTKIDLERLEKSSNYWNYVGKKKQSTDNINSADLKERDNPNEVNFEKKFLSTHYVDDPDGWTNLREMPKGNIIKRLDNKTECKFLKSENGWNFIELENGEKGFIHGSRLKKISLSD